MFIVTVDGGWRYYQRHYIVQKAQSDDIAEQMVQEQDKIDYPNDWGNGCDPSVYIYKTDNNNVILVSKNGCN